MEKLKYVSPEYQLQLENLADTLAAGRRERLAQEAADTALQDTVEFPSLQEPLWVEPEVA